MAGKVSLDDAAEALEPILDKSTKQELQKLIGNESQGLLESLPLLKYAVITERLFSGAKDAFRRRKLLVFLEELNKGNKKIGDYESLSDDDREFIRGLIISELDAQTDERQAEATALIATAYLKKDVDRLSFVGVLSEIKATNPLLYYFSVDSLILEIEGEAWKLKGPTHLLPSAFGHNTISGIGRLDSIGEYYFVLSTLGKVFFKYVYQPMNEKYQI